jgi:hypothetical protein
MYVSFRDSLGYGESCSIKTVTPRCCNGVGLVGYKLKKLLHKVWICNHEIFFIPFSFCYTCSFRLFFVWFAYD